VSFADLLAADIRLVLLRSLEEAAGYSCNESVLASMLTALGHKVSRDRVRTELHWLSEQGLVSVEDVLNVLVATLTPRGADVATGCATVPGVKRPRPRDC
jgi:Fe2+ or Zn2+ uptake regulation protein